MSFESPISVLYNSEGNEIAVSQSQFVNISTQPGLVMAGSGSDGRAHFFRTTADGALFVTGSVTVVGTGAATTVVSSAAATLTSFTMLAADPLRKIATFFKEGTNTAYLKFGATASDTSYTVKLSNNGYYETPERYTGQIDIVFSTAMAGNLLYVTSITY